MDLLEKYLISDAKTNNEKVCFHCKSAAPVKGQGSCAKCARELEAWRNKRKNKRV